MTVPAQVFGLPYRWQIAIVTYTFQRHHDLWCANTHARRSSLCGFDGWNSRLASPLTRTSVKNTSKVTVIQTRCPCRPFPTKLPGLKCHYLHLTFDTRQILKTKKHQLFENGTEFLKARRANNVSKLVTNHLALNKHQNRKKKIVQSTNFSTIFHKFS